MLFCQVSPGSPLMTKRPAKKNLKMKLAPPLERFRQLGLFADRAVLRVRRGVEPLVADVLAGGGVGLAAHAPLSSARVRSSGDLYRPSV